MERNTWAAITCSNFTTLMLGICDNRQGQQLDYMYEHMARDGSLDAVNLQIISADTRCLYISSYHVLQFDETDAGRL